MLYDKKWDKPVEAPVQLEPWRQAWLDAAEVIRKRGWCVDNFQSHGRVCMLGALSVALGAKPSAEGGRKRDIFYQAENSLSA